MNNNLELSSAITKARFPLTVLVVMIHTNIAAVLYAKGVEYHITSDVARFVIHLFSHTLGQLAVPLFFMISGYLFAAKVSSFDDYKNGIKKRAKSVLLPYIIWNFLGMLVVLLPRLPLFNNLFPNAGHEPFSLGVALKGFWANTYGIDPSKATLVGPWDMPLWYIRDLMVMFVATPLILWFHEKIRVLWLAICFGFFMFAPTGMLLPGISGTSILFYTLGIYILKNGWGGYFIVSSRRVLWLPIVAFATVTLLVNVETNIYVEKTYRIIGAFFSLMLFANSGKDKRDISLSTKFLAGSSFFIYAVHTLYNGIITKVLLITLKLPLQVGLGYSMIIYIGSVTLTISIALLLYNMVRKNKLLSTLLTGGR